MRGVYTGGGTALARRGGIIHVVKRYIRESRLRQRLSNELTLLVLEMRVVASGFLLSKRPGFGKPLFVLPLDDLGNALKRGMSEGR